MDQLELDFAVAAFSDYDADGHLQIQTDSPGSRGGTTPAEALCPLGFYARPLDPEKDEANGIGIGASLLTVRGGNDRFNIPFNDPRDAALIPKLKKGGRAFAGGAGDYRSFIAIDGLDPDGKKASGSIDAIASYEKAGKKTSLAFNLNVRTPGKEVITILHGEGHHISLNAKRAITLMNANADAWVQVDDKGISLAGDTKVQGSMQVGQTKSAKPVAIAPAVIAALNTLAQAIVAVASAASAAPGAQGAGPAAATALQALPSQITQIFAKHLSST